MRRRDSAMLSVSFTEACRPAHIYGKTQARRARFTRSTDRIARPHRLPDPAGGRMRTQHAQSPPIRSHPVRHRPLQGRQLRLRRTAWRRLAGVAGRTGAQDIAPHGFPEPVGRPGISLPAAQHRQVHHRGTGRAVACRHRSGKRKPCRGGVTGHGKYRHRLLPEGRQQQRAAAGDAGGGGPPRQNHSVLPASAFIDAAHELRLTHQLDRAIILQTFSRCVATFQPHTPRTHFVNISANLLRHPDVVTELLAEASRSWTARGHLIGPVKPIVLELIERALLDGLPATRSTLPPFLDSGIRLALGDFGSGYSSYQYPADLPFSFLKSD